MGTWGFEDQVVDDLGKIKFGKIPINFEVDLEDPGTMLMVRAA